MTWLSFTGLGVVSLAVVLLVGLSRLGHPDAGMDCFVIFSVIGNMIFVLFWILTGAYEFMPSNMGLIVMVIYLYETWRRRRKRKSMLTLLGNKSRALRAKLVASMPAGRTSPVGA